MGLCACVNVQKDVHTFARLHSYLETYIHTYTVRRRARAMDSWDDATCD